jgi:PhzF family phenazine biosynthesis protein
MSIPLFKVDAFTDHAFSGNPAAICLLDGPRPDQWMQSVATEMALSETAFLLPKDEGASPSGRYHLRWFTPLKEVRLCGHATLASAFVLWQNKRQPVDSVLYFNTLSGLLTARQNQDWIELNFPSKPVATAEAPAGLLESLGVTAPLAINRDESIYLIEVGDEDIVRQCRPDFSRLRQVVFRSVGITARSTDPRYDFVSRYFAPRVGVNEDPVTGSIHCRLTPYWSQKLGKQTLTARQVSARGGTLRLNLQQDRVLISGQAVMVMVGSLNSD